MCSPDAPADREEVGGRKMENWEKREGTEVALQSEEKLPPSVERWKRQPPALEKVDMAENGGQGEGRLGRIFAF